MKKTLLLSAATLLLGIVGASAQTLTLSTFTFETTQPATAGPFAAEVNNLANGGTAQTLGSHAATSTYSSPAGSGGSAHSFSSTAWAINDYYQVTLSNTTGYSGLNVSFAVSGSNTGPANFNFQYSTDGTTFTTFGAYAVTATFATKTFDLSGLTALNDSGSAIYFRLTDASTTSINGGTVAAGGTNRFDNFTVSGVAATPAPEPSAYATMALGILGTFAMLRARRRTA